MLPIIQGLKLYFIGCFEREEFNNNSTTSTTSTVYSQWLQRQLDAFTTALLSNLSSTSTSDATCQVASFASLMELTRVKQPGVFDNELFFKIVATVTGSAAVAPEVVGLFLEKYAAYADVYYYLNKSIAKLCTSKSKKEEEQHDKKEEDEDFVRTVYDILSRLPSPVSLLSEDTQLRQQQQQIESWCGAAEVNLVTPANDASGPRQRKRLKNKQQHQVSSTTTTATTTVAKWASVKLRRKSYSDAWMALLRCPLPTDVYRKLLARLHDLVIPNLTTPLLLSDFLTHSLDRGGLDGMLALHGIFILVTQHGLEYPRFYERLYATLLTPDAFLSKHRIRFFQLADIFLASPMVPAYTAAAFVKKFARLALHSPPSGALIAIAFIHNLVRRHPACVQLIHRVSTTSVPSAQLPPVWQGVDVYDANQPDPAKSRALESSLWELTALRCHADPTVAASCTVLDAKDLRDRKRTAEIDVSEVLAASYGSIFTKEVGRRLKQVPAAFYGADASMPKQILGGGSGGGGGGSSGFVEWVE